MAIFGSSNLSDSGDLLIFNKVSYKTLLMFEKELGRDPHDLPGGRRPPPGYGHRLPSGIH